MIYQDIQITVNQGLAQPDKSLYIFRGDSNIILNFKLVTPQYMLTKDKKDNLVTRFGVDNFELRLQLEKDYNKIIRGVITEDGYCRTQLTQNVIQELRTGTYSYQITLIDDDANAIMTFPICKAKLNILDRMSLTAEELAVPGGLSGEAMADLSLIADNGKVLEAFDSKGNYIKTNWKAGDVISSAKLNKIEEGIDGVNKKVNEVATKGTTNAVIKDATTEEVNRLLEAGELTYLTIAPGTIDSTKLSKEVNDTLGKMVIPTTTAYAVKNRYGGYIGSDIEHINIEGAPADSLLVLRSENLFDVDSYKNISAYYYNGSYSAAPIQLAPNTSYDVYLFYKYESGTSHGITCNNFLINQDPWWYSAGGTGISLKRTSNYKQTLTTDSRGCLYVTPVYGHEQKHIDAAFNAFDIVIVEEGKTVNGYVKGKSKKVAFSNTISVTMDDYISAFVNKERNKDTMNDSMPDDCTMSISYQSLDYDKISKNISIVERQKSPLIYYTENWASFWYNDRIPRGLQGTNSYLKVTGVKGESKLTVVDGGNFELSSIDGFTNWGAVLGYGDGTYKSCLVINHDSSTNTINIYPPLEKNITDGELGNMAIDGMHLTKLGYRAYMQHNYNQNPKHCEKGKYIHKFAPSTNGASEPIPFKKIEGSHRISYDIGRVNRNEVIQNSYSQNYFGISNPWDELVEKKAGMYWEVPLYNLKGYLELMISGTRENYNDILFDDGFEMHIEFYLDDILQKHIIKKNRNLDRLCFDFENAQKGKVVIYYNKMRINNERIIISDSTWWINEYEHKDKLIPNYNIVSQLFDSWGEFHEGESGKEMSRLINEANGLTIPYYNTSKGSQTSAWGRSWWYEHVFSKRPNIMITDFGINDCNSRGADVIPSTVKGSDGLDYNNKITKEIYKENMNAIYQLCINNNILPIHFGATMGSYMLGDWYLYLTYGEKYELD